MDEDYFILTLFALALEAKSRGITLSGKDIVLGIGLPPADFGQQVLDSRDILWNIPSMVSPLSLTENRLTVI